MGNVTSIQRIEAGGSEKRAKQNPMCQTSHRRCGGTSTEKIIFGRFLSKKGDELYSTKQDIIFKNIHVRMFKNVHMCVLGASQVALVVKNLPPNAGDIKSCKFDPWVRKIAWRKAGQPTPLFLPGESQGQRSLAGYSPSGRKESDTTEAT